MDKTNLKDKSLGIIKSDIFQEITISAIGCISFTFLFFLFPDKCWDYPYRVAICGIFTLIFLVISLCLNQANPKNNFFKINYKRNIILFSIFNYSTLCFLYFQTYLTTNGIFGDNVYRTAFVTKMAYSGYPHDFVYKDLTAFMGPLYWYCLALIAKLFNIKPYRMLKLGMLFMAYAIPIILFEVWKKIYQIRVAFIISVLSTLILNDPYSPDHLISLLLIIPFIMYYFENCTNKDFSLRNYIIGGFYGSIIFCTYYLYFLMIPIYYIIMLFQNKKKFIENFKHIFLITFFLLLFSSWFWFPLIQDILFIGFESHQNRYFADQILKIPIGSILNTSLVGLSFLLGFVYIIKKYKKSVEMRILGNLLLSIVIIYILGLLGVLTHFPIAHIRFEPVFLYILIIASSVFYVKLLDQMKNKDILGKFNIKLNLTQVWIYLLIILICSTTFNHLKSCSESDAYYAANEQDINYHLLDVIDELDYEDKVILTQFRTVAAYRPVNLFIFPNPYFSHPSALYNERVKFLVELSESKSSNELFKDATDNKFDVIDYFWLEPINNNTEFLLTVAVEQFPEGRDYYEIVFKKELFENPKYFKKLEIDGDIIFETKY
ncbi:MAG: arabinofuranosyltransferase [Candidatus Hodarchaeota archaeon]